MGTHPHRVSLTHPYTHSLTHRHTLTQRHSHTLTHRQSHTLSHTHTKENIGTRKSSIQEITISQNSKINYIGRV